MQQASEAQEVRQLDDPALLELRRQIRELLQHNPDSGPDLARAYDLLTEELDRRARAAWTEAPSER